MNKDKSNKPTSIFPSMEQEVLDFWDKGKTFEKSVEKEAPNGDYVFYDGPPFATGLPHYGHIVASVIKDVVPRYWTMKGYRVERKWGWDCHGLPIENIVEKEMGTKSKKDIEEMGVDVFNEKCRSKVMVFAEDWKRYIKKLGRWVDMENDYKTMDLDFMESVWWVFKRLWDNDLIYKDYRSMHICPRCETTLSQSEVTEGYMDIKDLSAIAKFKIKQRKTHPALSGTPLDRGELYILAWTTTPWTLIGNVALAVGEDIKYSVVRLKAQSSNVKTTTQSSKLERYIVASDLVEAVFKDGEYELEKEVLGSDLAGLEYKPLFDYFAGDENLENRENGWKVYGADFVTTEEGTGVVHIAPAFGEDDMRLGREHKLPFVQHVNLDGSFTVEVKDFKDANVKPKDDHMATDIEIIKYLAHNDLLFHKEKYEHSYPHCWRCDTPLLNYATSSWFVAVTKIKEQLLKNAKNINWSPAHIKEGRFGKWLEGARDWSISRQRFWASVIPIWECECGERTVVGSVQELEELSGEKITDLHKHTVDKITFACDKCKKTMKRIPDVLDCWFESGSMPYAQMHYPFENKEKFEANFPAQFIAEGADQTRAWFYYLHVLAQGTKNTEAFKNVIVNGIVLAEDGKKMSKKLQNYPDPMEIFDKFGADALRYYLLTSPVMLADTLCFTESGVSGSTRKINMLLWNVYKFYAIFADNDANMQINANPQIANINNVLDRWILARLDELVKEVEINIEAYNLPKATRPIQEFIDDLSTWYLRRSRDRFKSTDKKDKQAALDTTRYVLITLAKVMAPFTPFIAEQVWQKATGYDFADTAKSVHLEEWPTTRNTQHATHKNIIESMEITRKIVEMGLAKRDEVGIKVRQPLSELRITGYELQVDYAGLIRDEVNVKKTTFCKEGEVSVELNAEITEDLKLEGIKRELVRSINTLRKKEGLTIEDRIEVLWSSDSADIKKAIDQYEKELMADVLADKISEGGEGKDVMVNGEMVKIGIQKI